MQLLSNFSGGIFHDAGSHIYVPPLDSSDHWNLAVFESPEKFDPERYIKSEYGIKNGANPDGLRDTLPFGAGRVSSLFTFQRQNYLTTVSSASVPVLRWVNARS